MKGTKYLTVTKALIAIKKHLKISLYKNWFEESKLVCAVHTPGGMHKTEAQIMYCLMRSSQPENIIELGTFRGCGTTYLAAAVKKNCVGIVNTVDVRKDQHYAADFPDNLREFCVFHNNHALEFMRGGVEMADFIIEDLTHRLELTRDVLREGVKRLTPGGIFISHDAMLEHGGMGQEIQDAFESVGILDDTFICSVKSKNGLAIWRKPL